MGHNYTMTNKSLYAKEYNQTIKSISFDDETLTLELDETKLKFSSYHEQDCCEHVYADFSIMQYYKKRIEKAYLATLEIKGVSGMGFLLVLGHEKVFIPCYNYQNGYYSDYLELQIQEGATTAKIALAGFVPEPTE